MYIAQNLGDIKKYTIKTCNSKCKTEIKSILNIPGCRALPKITYIYTYCRDLDSLPNMS